jgi:uncharacterized protein YsxB (DUF464 family)
MIEIHATLSDKRVIAVDISGHGGGKAGSDIVCAAVSAIAETALAGVLHHNPDCITWKMDKGHISIHVHDSAETSVSAIMTTMMLGLKQLAEEYPGQVSLHLIDHTGITDKA